MPVPVLTKYSTYTIKQLSKKQRDKTLYSGGFFMILNFGT